MNTFCAIDVASFKPGCFNHKGLCQLYNWHLLYSQQRKELVRPPVRRARVTMQYSSHFKHFRNWNILVGFVKCGMSNAQKCLIHELHNSNPVSTIVCSLVPTFLGSFMVNGLSVYHRSWDNCTYHLLWPVVLKFGSPGINLSAMVENMYPWDLVFKMTNTVEIIFIQTPGT